MARQHAKSAQYLRRRATERAVLELNIDAVEFMQLSRDILDMSRGEGLHPSMRAPQQILVQVEDLDIHAGLQLLLQGSGIARNSAKFVVGADDREPGAARHAVIRRIGF
ncbi:hypothetical protein [Falsiroseomonas sp.]|uniref:hypothetical protein n=1 Tax=Falsiroseomonas sp. TaxID=2870721 RepID=UPI002716BF1D|nr:hypothetical protein [Falsiroseomonas sp.]MDO9502162.1 hypothetical protein [Falsiroseomonas sp.]